MNLQDRLEDAFERGCDDEGASLSPDDLAHYRAWRFILEWEMGSLTGYLYNTLPDLGAISATRDALTTVGLTELASILGKALALFQDYRDPQVSCTWGEVLKQCDPTDQLRTLDSEIQALENYGITS